MQLRSQNPISINVLVLLSTLQCIMIGSRITTTISAFTNPSVRRVALHYAKTIPSIIKVSQQQRNMSQDGANVVGEKTEEEKAAIKAARDARK